MRARIFSIFENQLDTPELLWLVENEPNGLRSGVRGAPAMIFRLKQRRFDWIAVFFRGDLDQRSTIQV